jgi:hypothetical protein
MGVEVPDAAQSDNQTGPVALSHVTQSSAVAEAVGDWRRLKVNSSQLQQRR